LPEGRLISETEWQAKHNEWLPSNEDRAFVASLMGRVVEPGKFANWIASPALGINRQPADFEYVRFNLIDGLIESKWILRLFAEGGFESWMSLMP
jgi:hypothetical protein